MIYSAPWELVPPPILDQEQSDKTKGVWAYRYNGYLFRSHIPAFADIYHAGQYLANRIPRDSEKRQTWIEQIVTLIENELQWRSENWISISETVFPVSSPYATFNWTSLFDIAPDHPVDDRSQIAFMRIAPDYAHWWHSLDAKKWPWIYVIDLQDRAFTINGTLHFSFDNIPQSISKCLVRPSRHLTGYIMTPKAEVLHSTFARRWPPSFLMPSENLTNSYDMVSPVIAHLEEWRTRTWDELNASESLSVHLAATIIRDQATQIRNPDKLDDRRMFFYYQWQMITVAAPSAVDLSSSFIPPYSRAFHPHIDLGLGPEGPDSRWYGEGVAYHGDWKPPPPMWFRGCLVVLCHRLDTMEFVKSEVYQMTQNLRSSSRDGAVGLLFDGRNVVGVTLSSTQIRHSPALPIFNHQLRLADGFRLMMHLLSPCLLTEKVPWHASVCPPTRSSLPLPTEIILEIIRLVDYDTYSTLPRVSYTFRSLSFLYPRLGKFILLQPTQGGAFRAFDTTYQQQCCVYLNRRMVSSSNLSFRFYHCQPKLGPTFFTPLEYGSARTKFRIFPSRNQPMEHIGNSNETKNIQLGLRVLDEYVPYFDEPLIPDAFVVRMQVVLGTWTLDLMEDPEEIEDWYRHHVAQSLITSANFDADMYL